MYTKETSIKNATGLHARPASEFVATAGKFQSKISIRRLSGDNQEPVNAKSIVFLLTLGIEQGTSVEIAAEGEDEQLAVDTLIALINSGFGE